MKISTPSTGQQSTGLSSLEDSATGRHRNAGQQTPSDGSQIPKGKEPLQKTVKIRAELIYFHCAVPSFSQLRYDELKIQADMEMALFQPFPSRI